MNYKMVGFVLGRIFLIEAALMLFPMGCAAIYGEWASIPAFLIPVLILLVLGLAACGSTTPEVPKDDPQTPAETPVQDPAAPEEPQTGKTLVVYYSASGHTRQVAQAIAQAAELNKGV